MTAGSAAMLFGALLAITGLVLLVIGATSGAPGDVELFGIRIKGFPAAVVIFVAGIVVFALPFVFPLADGSTSSPIPSAERPSVAPPVPARSSPPPSASLLPPDFPPVRQQRHVSLSMTPRQESVAIDDWRSVHDGTGDLRMDQTGIVMQKGAMLAVIEDAPEPTYARCSQVQTWQPRTDFVALHVGSQLCARSKLGRYAMLQVTSLPSMNDPEFIFYGRVWELQH
jgi:hypothetical protein